MLGTFDVSTLLACGIGFPAVLLKPGLRRASTVQEAQQDPLFRVSYLLGVKELSQKVFADHLEASNGATSFEEGPTFLKANCPENVGNTEFGSPFFFADTGFGPLFTGFGPFVFGR